MSDLHAAIELKPAHISWYQLTLEPNTVFYARPPANLPDDDLAFEIQEHGQALLANHGYLQYEISAYARDGLQCKHNLNYWLFGDYLGAGAGAHGKLTTPDGIYRYQKPANPLQYMMFQESDSPETSRTVLDHDDLMFDFMLNSLRLRDGFAESIFLQRTGLSASDLMNATHNARRRGLIERDDNEIWKPTELGGRFLNDLQAEFIVERA
jgi:oxygen-independent coproporphyrinogen-3 oxidase